MRARRALLLEITRRQRKRINEFRQTPPDGRIVKYAGHEFVVYPEVFWAGHDNLLLEHMEETIKPGCKVLDIGTGTGIMAILAAHNGADNVVATDISQQAELCALENVRRHKLGGQVEVRQSDMYENIRSEEKFRIILANLPFRKKRAKNNVEASMWDINLKTLRSFFAKLNQHLEDTPNARAYLCQSNYGAVNEMKQLAAKNGFIVRRIATRRYSKGHEVYPAEFYAYEIKRK